MAQLLADEDFDNRVVRELRSFGHDVITVVEAGHESAQDSEVLQLATEGQRALITFNRKDFRKLHRSTPGHAGVLLCTRDPEYDALAKRIHDSIEEYDDLEGILIRIVRPRGS